MRVLFIGDDWAEDHHDVELEDEGGRRLARARLPEGLEGITRLHALVAEHAPAAWAELPSEQVAGQVVVGIVTDRGPWVTALRSAGYVVYAINPLSAARYRERHSTSGAKSDAGDAHVLAEIVRLDRAHHRPIAGDSELADAVNYWPARIRTRSGSALGSCCGCVPRCASISLPRSRRSRI